MFGFRKKSVYNKEESYKYIANYLIGTLRKENKNIFAFVSSGCNLKEIVTDIGKQACKKVKTLVVNVCFDDKSKNLSDSKNMKVISINDSAEKFKDCLLKYESEFDLILISLNSILTKAESIEYAKVCKEIIIIEKCTQCYYSDYENILAGFKTADINPRGDITVC